MEIPLSQQNYAIAKEQTEEIVKTQRMVGLGALLGGSLLSYLSYAKAKSKTTKWAGTIIGGSIGLCGAMSTTTSFLDGRKREETDKRAKSLKFYENETSNDKLMLALTELIPVVWIERIKKG